MKDIHEWLAQIGCRAPQAVRRSTSPTTRDLPRVLSPRARPEDHAASRARCCRLLPGLTLVELPGVTWCCGSAGIYNITQPGQSAMLLERKVRHIIATGASKLATSNPGCHLQIARGLRAAGSGIQVVQPVTLLARAYQREQNATRNPRLTHKPAAEQKLSPVNL